MNCIDCIHMAYQCTIDGDMVAMCVLRDKEIEIEEAFSCISFEDAGLPF